MDCTIDTPTARANALYEMLEDALALGEGFLTQSDAAKRLAAYYPDVNAGKNFHATTARRQMSDDIQRINASKAYDRVIVSTGRGIKLADRADAVAYLRSAYKATFKRLARIREMDKALSMDGQGVFDGDFLQFFGEGG